MTQNTCMESRYTVTSWEKLNKMLIFVNYVLRRRSIEFREIERTNTARFSVSKSEVSRLWTNGDVARKIIDCILRVTWDGAFRFNLKGTTGLFAPKNGPLIRQHSSFTFKSHY